MEYMYELKEKLCDELEEIAKKPEMSAGDLETVHKLTDTIKNIDKIEMLEDGEYSQNGDWEARGYFEGDYGERRGGRTGRSGRRTGRGGQRYSSGRYARDRYSRDGAKEEMMEHLDEMMESASSEKEREIIRRCMTQLEKA